MEKSDENAWVILENYPKLILADLAKSRLGLNGIEAEIFDGIHANMMWLHTNAIGGIKLKVKRKDLERAKEVLSEDVDTDEDIVNQEDEIGAGSPYCSRCHSKNIEVKTIWHAKSNSPFKAWAIRLFGNDKVLRCRSCAYKWKL